MRALIRAWFVGCDDVQERLAYQGAEADGDTVLDRRRHEFWRVRLVPLGSWPSRGLIGLSSSGGMPIANLCIEEI